MKKNNAILAGVAAVALAAAMVPAAMAIDVSGDATGQTSTATDATKVTYQVTASYTWSVPTGITFTSDQTTIETSGESGATQNVAVSKNVIPNKTKVQVKLVSTTHNFHVQSGEGAQLPYSVSADAKTLIADSEILSVPAGTPSGDKTLTFVLTKDKDEKAGTYTDQITYSAAVVADNGNA